MHDGGLLSEKQLFLVYASPRGMQGGRRACDDSVSSSRRLLEEAGCLHNGFCAYACGTPLR
jgi:hypothetical protein